MTSRCSGVPDIQSTDTDFPGENVEIPGGPVTFAGAAGKRLSAAGIESGAQIAKGG
jgi:hypothetical protein